jgi:hypothetical protein
MVDQLFPYVQKVRKYLQTNFWPSDEKINKVASPILFILSINCPNLGERDELVPPVHMETLFSLATGSVLKKKVN